jgi:hypothetical protein
MATKIRGLWYLHPRNAKILRWFVSPFYPNCRPFYWTQTGWQFDWKITQLLRTWLADTRPTSDFHLKYRCMFVHTFAVFEIVWWAIHMSDFVFRHVQSIVWDCFLTKVCLSRRGLWLSAWWEWAGITSVTICRCQYLIQKLQICHRP